MGVCAKTRGGGGYCRSTHDFGGKVSTHPVIGVKNGTWLINKILGCEPCFWVLVCNKTTELSVNEICCKQGSD